MPLESTKCRYLQLDASVAEWPSARLLAVNPVVLADTQKSSKKTYPYAVVLEETIFHPQGGGQPSDTGRISLVSKEADGVFVVEHVAKRQTPEGSTLVEHFGHFSPKTPELLWTEGTDVALSVDAERRQLHARLHTAGHLLDYGMHFYVGIPHHLVSGGKGFHFSEGPNVEFILDCLDGRTGRTELTMEDKRLQPDSLKPVLQSAVDDLIQRKLQHEALDVSYEEVPESSRRVLSANIAPGSVVRLLRLQDYESLMLPCGGTHVSNTASIGSMVISKVVVKRHSPTQLYIKVSYCVH
jgi:Ser-tRNA(Ala) deacylase AlaX